MTETSPPKRAKSEKRLRRFFRGISAAASWSPIPVDSTPEAVVQPLRPARRFVTAGGGSARTNFTNVDGCNLRPEAKAAGTEALPVRADAGAAVPLQSGMRGMR